MPATHSTAARSVALDKLVRPCIAAIVMPPRRGNSTRVAPTGSRSPYSPRHGGSPSGMLAWRWWKRGPRRPAALAGHAIGHAAGLFPSRASPRGSRRPADAANGRVSATDILAIIARPRHGSMNHGNTACTHAARTGCSKPKAEAGLRKLSSAGGRGLSTRGAFATPAKARA